MCKLHGVRLIKGIKIFESMLKKSTFTTNKTAGSRLSTHHWYSIIAVCCVKILGVEMQAKCST